jgi:hypothetical protein
MHVTNRRRLGVRPARFSLLEVCCAFVVVLVLARSSPARADAPARPSRSRCDAPMPIAQGRRQFRHFMNRLVMDHEAAFHRGRDVFVRDGDAQWVVAKFEYGLPGRALADEDVDVYLLRDCSRWESLGSVRTSSRGAVVALPDGTTSRDDGLVAIRIPDHARLAVGMHRVRFVVRGDRSYADALVDVLPRDAHFVVSDIDGTLTESESAVFLWELGVHRVPTAHPGAAAVLRRFASLGYHVFYLTGRPEWTAAETHEWLRANGFPLGVLRERSDLHTGLFARNVGAYKIRNLVATAQTFGRAPDFAFGNTEVDVAAYDAASVDDAHQFYYRFDGDRRGGRRNDDYRALLVGFAGLPSIVATETAATMAPATLSHF